MCDFETLVADGDPHDVVRKHVLFVGAVIQDVVSIVGQIILYVVMAEGEKQLDKLWYPGAALPMTDIGSRQPVSTITSFRLSGV